MYSKMLIVLILNRLHFRRLKDHTITQSHHQSIRIQMYLYLTSNA